MMVLWELFRTFFVIGFVSFGGGYAMIPVIEAEVSQHGWMTTQQFTDVIAIAGMSPGPIAANSAILVGYSTAGIAGAIASTLGILLPAIIIVIVVATFFTKLNDYPVMQSIFYGLRPIVTSLIIYAAIRFALSNNLINWNQLQQTFSLLLIFGLSLVALMKFRWHPVYIIILSGLVGIALYS
jgi:chromate transporter